MFRHIYILFSILFLLSDVVPLLGFCEVRDDFIFLKSDDKTWLRVAREQIPKQEESNFILYTPNDEASDPSAHVLYFGKESTRSWNLRNFYLKLYGFAKEVSVELTGVEIAPVSVTQEKSSIRTQKPRGRPLTEIKVGIDCSTEQYAELYLKWQRFHELYTQALESHLSPSELNLLGHMANQTVQSVADTYTSFGHWKPTNVFVDRNRLVIFAPTPLKWENF